MIKKQKTVGLALGGGGARGCAHVGVIKALQEAGIRIDCIAGTSIGAFVGGVFAAGNIDELEKYLLKIKWKDVVKYMDPVLPKQGLFGGEKVRTLADKMLTRHTFKNIKIPFIAVATDLETGKEAHLQTGKISEAIRASIAIPGIFTPFKKDGKYLLDGGLVNPVPVNVVRKMGADIVIAVDLNHHFFKEQLRSKESLKNSKNKIAEWFTPSWPNIIDVIAGSVFMMEDQLAEKNFMIHKPDILLRPRLESASIFDFHHAKKLIDEGYRITKNQIPAIKRLIQDS
jgi:NTE family protein